jgi:hypothetical protein
MMDVECKKQMALIFEQLRVLRESVNELLALETEKVRMLRGHQTVDTSESLNLSFSKLQEDIVSMEEVLASIAEATGDISKL